MIALDSPKTFAHVSRYEEAPTALPTRAITEKVYPDIEHSASRIARAGGSAARLLLKLETPEARASTPAPTMFFARLTVLDGTEAPFGSRVPAAAIKLCLAGVAALTGRITGRVAAFSSENPSAGSASRHKRSSHRDNIFRLRRRSSDFRFATSSSIERPVRRA